MSSEENHAFRLTPEQRSNLVPDIDVDALQRFLAYAAKSDEEREPLLMMFMQRANMAFAIIGVAGGGDPTIAALLDEVWAPTWLKLGREGIENSDSPLPGRELARARLGLATRPED